jgi:hypothetical protein
MIDQVRPVNRDSPLYVSIVGLAVFVVILPSAGLWCSRMSSRIQVR